MRCINRAYDLKWWWTYTTSSSLSLSLLHAPSTPCLSSVANCVLSPASSPSNLSPSISASLTPFAMRNFSVSIFSILSACPPASCRSSSHRLPSSSPLSRRDKDLSAECWLSRRDCRAVEREVRESEMRERLSRSGAMWNWFVVSFRSAVGSSSKRTMVEIFLRVF